MTDTQFIPGLIIKEPRQGAPEYVKAKLSIKRAELLAWLQLQTGDWINADIKVSQNGKWYCQIDNWKPDGGKRQDAAPAPATQRPVPVDNFQDSDIPF